jgi:predicted Zn-ribbon and HTH transcriptional regulator
MNPRCLRCDGYEVDFIEDESNNYFRCKNCDTDWIEPKEVFKDK